MISVIIPTYNRDATIQRAIDSVLGQSFNDFELIVIDDGSTDKTQKILKSYNHHIVAVRQENKGVSSARNRGIKIAKGEWIALLDSDDAWKKNKLQKQMDFIDADKKIKICQTDEVWIRDGKQVNPGHKHKKVSGWIFESCLPLCLVSPSAVMIKQEVFEKIGPFDENMPACEDYDLWLRCALYYPIYLLEDKLTIKYGGHEDQLSKTVWGLDQYRIYALEKILKDKKISAEQKKSVLKELLYKTDVFMKGCKKRGKQKDWDLYSKKKNIFSEALASL